MKGSPLLSQIFIFNCPFFAVTWCLSKTPMCLFVYYNEPGIKSETSGVMWLVAPESKIQLVNCKLSPTFPLGNSKLPDIRAIYTYIFWSPLFLPFWHARLTFSLKRTCFWCFSYYFGGFRHFAMRWSIDPHLKHFQGVRSVRLFSESPAARAFLFSCLILWNIFM